MALPARDTEEGTTLKSTPPGRATTVQSEGLRVPANSDLFAQLKSDPLVVVMSGFWGLFMIGFIMWTNWRNSRQQSTVDAANNKLVENLNAALNAASLNTRDERDRADRLYKEVSTLNIEIGGIRSDLKYVTEDREEARKEIARLNEIIERLVAESRAKDKSISRLVSTNKQILRAIGSDPDTLSSTPLLPEPDSGD